ALFASQGSPVWAALGSLTALVASTALAVLLGQVLARMSARARLVVRLVGALVFVVVGVVQLVDGIGGLGAG
ncbi:MAG TPA: TMEM165/GDT1 family protein, partial [Myxococcota bacterium]|nr:TMEM165/GDT1 family protein [Myxococcota bacterium]